MWQKVRESTAEEEYEEEEGKSKRWWRQMEQRRVKREGDMAKRRVKLM